MRHRFRRRSRALRIALVENQWLLPLLGALTGALLAFILSDFDREPDPEVWAISVDRARDTMMSILAILFAGLAIVLSLATMTAQTVASRFSLRLLRVHLRGLADKVVIGIFTFTTTFIVIEQARMTALAGDELAPRASVVVSGFLLLGSGLAIIWHINHTLQSIRVDRIVRDVARFTRRASASAERIQRRYDPLPTADLVPPPSSEPVFSTEAGHVVTADMDALSDVATGTGLTVCIEAPVGTWLVPGDAIGWVDHDEGGAVDRETMQSIADSLSLEPSRDPVVDVGYGIRVMVDIALMALSPAINDPYTAIQCIDQLAGVFAAIGELNLGPFAWTDADGNQRVRIHAVTPGDLLAQAIGPMLPYADSDESVLGALERLAHVGQRTLRSEADRSIAEGLAAEIASCSGRRPATVS